ncbi:MAG: aspartate carbamoyltransferase [Candidatus Muiribacteriaceae bacterium]
MNFLGRDIISINDLSRPDIEFLLDKAHLIESMPESEKKELLRGKVIASLFFEPSTRTKDSFTAACLKLGGSIVGFTDTSQTSLKKGESLFDTVKMYEQYTDCVVMRHSIEGAARYAAESISIPVINGGDGANQHPTQTLLDLYSIRKVQNSIDGLNIAVAGDLKYGRTVHSLAMALSLFDNCTLFFVSPDSLKIPDHYKQILSERGVIFSEHTDISEVIENVDIIYMTRIQAERFPDKTDYEKVKGFYVLKRSMLDFAKDNLKIMHPLPRVDEIDTDVDSTEFAYYFEQAANGIPVRQALLSLLTGVLS